MKIFPAIDIKDKKCVRLVKGDFDNKTEYKMSPIDQAGKYKDHGFKNLHIVDLDGAVQGNPINHEIIFEIASQFPNKRIQIGGGIRNFDSALEYLQRGIERVIMGTSAVEDPGLLKDFCERYPERVVLGIDALNGIVKTQGWLKGSEVTPSDLVKNFEGDSIAAIIFTDISKDGMMIGPNIEATSDLARETDIPVIASGGVSSLEHITQLANEKIISGVICGRALYENSFSYEEALRVVTR